MLRLISEWSEWGLLAITTPFLLFPTVYPMATVAALAILVLSWLRALWQRQPWPVTPFNGALLLFAIMVGVGIGITPYPDLTLPEAMHLILGLAVFRALVSIVKNQHSLATGVAIFCLLGAIITIIGLMGVQWQSKVPLLRNLGQVIPHLINSIPEDQGTPGVNPNHLAGCLTLYAPLALALVWEWSVSRRTSPRSLLLFFVLLVFSTLVIGALLLTQSRSGWFGGTAGLLALISLRGLGSRRRWARWLGVILPVAAITLAVILTLQFAPQLLQENLYDKIIRNPVEEMVGSISLADRVEIWSRALYAIQDFPLTGCGLGTFSRVVPLFYPLFTISPGTEITHAHNIFLQTALDLGLPGLVAYLALLMIAIALCWRQTRTGKNRWTRAVALGLAGGLIALHFYGLTDALALGSKPAVIFWFALGLVAAIGAEEFSVSD